MTYPRNKIINLSQTQYYHCVSRCVRRAFLCGKDRRTGKNYEHRRAWIENRLLLLAKVFSIDVYAYAVMHNHTHLVLYVNQLENNMLSDKDVLKRWSKIGRLDDICLKYLTSESNDGCTQQELDYVSNRVKILRSRLGNISWFMSLLNQHIARKANREDDCTGRFWEGRFKSQALLTEKAILACMSYVDLNPVRAGAANNIESSAYTSISRRLKLAKLKKNRHLLPVNAPRACSPQSFLHHITLRDYIVQLRAVIESKQSVTIKPITIGSLHINRNWIGYANKFEDAFSYVAGSKSAVDKFRKQVRASIVAARPKYIN